jgi:hypothetical protein
MDSLFNFLKRTGIGLLYILGSPLIVLGFTLFALYGTLVFLLTFLHSSYLWLFKGEGFFSKFPEDIRSETRYQDYLKQNPPTHKLSTSSVEDIK